MAEWSGKICILPPTDYEKKYNFPVGDLWPDPTTPIVNFVGSALKDFMKRCQQLRAPTVVEERCQLA